MSAGVEVVVVLCAEARETAGALSVSKLHAAPRRRRPCAGVLPNLEAGVVMYGVLAAATGLKLMCYIQCAALQSKSGESPSRAAVVAGGRGWQGGNAGFGEEGPGREGVGLVCGEAAATSAATRVHCCPCGASAAHRGKLALLTRARLHCADSMLALAEDHLNDIVSNVGAAATSAVAVYVSSCSSSIGGGCGCSARRG